MAKKRPILDRFWEKVNFNGPEPELWPGLGSCWLWMNGDDGRGYGCFYIVHGQPLKAHRFSYELAEGPIPKGMTLDHICRVTLCVNPAHLEVVTNTENVRRADSFGRINQEKAAGARCSKGHLKTEFNIAINRSSKGRYCLDCRAIRLAKRRARGEAAA